MSLGCDLTAAWIGKTNENMWIWSGDAKMIPKKIGGQDFLFIETGDTPRSATIGHKQPFRVLIRAGK